MVEEDNNDDLEFTPEQLRAALKDVGRAAREQAFAAGRPIYYIKDGAIVAQYADGTVEIVSPLKQPGNSSHQPK